MKVCGLFSGIGGFEVAFEREGGHCVGLCEIDETARAVLKTHFPSTPIHDDVQNLSRLPRADVLTAGFPCQDLSQAGPKVGIKGERSGLVNEIFRLLKDASPGPEWVILENVSYMLRLANGQAMNYILTEIEAMGYNWAYRVLDARCFGLPQRRERVIMLLSKRNDPSSVLFPEKYIESPVDDSVGAVDKDCLYGFYWTEGKRGLGWTKNAVPTIKGGSGLGIASPPAIWDPVTGEFGTPSIEDAERMFGYPAGWTASASAINPKKGARWKLVGNTVCVPMVDWVVKNIAKPAGLKSHFRQLSAADRPPLAAFGKNSERYSVNVSTWCKRTSQPKLRTFLKNELVPLSLRAATGFYSRAVTTTTIRFAEGFLDSLNSYIKGIK